jgi:DNA polymerase-1
MYRLLKTEEEIRRMCSDWGGREDVGLDTETVGFVPRKGELRLIQISDGKTTCIIDTRDFPRGLPTCLKEFLEAELPRKVMHNAKFDCLWLRVKYGIVVGGVFDTYLSDVMVATATLGIDMYGHALDDCVRRYLKIDVDKSLQSSDWSGSIEPRQYEYAAIDPKVTLQLRPAYIQRIVQNGLQNIARIEFGAVHAFGELEHNGFAADADRYRELLVQLKEEEKETFLALNAIVRPTRPDVGVQQSMFDGIEDVDYGAINLNSPAQIRKAFRDLGVPILDPKTELGLIEQYKKQGKPHATTTAFKEIEPLSVHYPILIPLLDYRSAEKAITAYGNWLDPKEPIIEKDGRIYCNFWQLKAMTGRTACSDPNLQQVKKLEIFRRVFKAPEGRKLVVADYSQFELRILAELSQDPAMMKVFRDGLDLHTMTTAGAFDLSYDDIVADPDKYKKQRGFGKMLNFSVVYGISAFAYAMKMHCTIEEAETYLAKFAQTYPVADDWLNATGNEGLRTLQSRTKAGRLVAFMKPTGNPGSKEFRGQQGAVRRNARNTPIQGLNADVLKLVLPRVMKAIEGYDAKLVHEVHDEIIVESAEDCAMDVGLILEKYMKEAAQEYVTTIPIEVGAAVCDDWSQKDKKEFQISNLLRKAA